ncbi:MAG: hypothetical protein K2L96_01905 [Muribaculaceae bacterium]|nr:hypothetical protein [Muribaculaceae bacterium]
MPEDNEDFRPGLYECFVKALVKPVRERYFEEDELIEIFDYAGDRGDDYVRWEVLFCGERLYPDSDGLRVRRAILYRETMPGTDIAGRYLADNQDSGSLLWRIERAVEESTDRAEAERRLDELLISEDRFGDEEIIRIVKLAARTGCYEWLMARADELRARASYLPVLLYESGMAFMDALDYERAAVYVEELTRLCPFESAYWALYSALMVRLKRIPEAREAFEFAAGLEIQDPETAVCLGGAAIDAMPDLVPVAIEKLEAAVEAEPDYFRSSCTLAGLYVSRGRNRDAERVLRAYAERCPNTRDTVSAAIELHLPCFTDIFETVMIATGGGAFSYGEVLRMVEGLIEDCRYEDALRLTDCYAGLIGENDDLRAMKAECCFRAGDFEGVCGLFAGPEHVMEILNGLAAGPRVAYFYLRSLHETGRAEEELIFGIMAGIVARDLYERADEGARFFLRELMDNSREEGGQ